MKKRTPTRIRPAGPVAIVGFAAMLATAAATHAAPPDATWEGRLQGTVRLRIQLLTENGERRAKLDSPDQGATGLPIEIRHLSDDSLSVWLAAAGGGWAGRISSDGRTLTGVWSQGGASFPLVLSRMEAAPDDSKPQEPKSPYPYDTEDVSFENKSAGVTLAGTVTRPRGGARSPAVLLVSGSGPQDRDEQIVGHKPFKLIADRLTRAGFVVLRYDDRGFGKSSGSFATATTFDFANDAAAGIEYLRRLPAVDPLRLVVLGHSEGGLIAARLAALDPKLAGIVMLAGPCVRGKALLEAQTLALMRAARRDSAGQQTTLRFNREVWREMAADTPNDTASARVERATRSFVGHLSVSDLSQIGDPETFVRSTAASASNPWLRAFVRHDPSPDLGKLRVPVLACFGELDLQVPPAANIPALQARFGGARSKLLTIRRWPRLNHLFQTANTGLPGEYGSIEETMAPEVLEELVTWLRQTTAGFDQ